MTLLSFEIARRMRKCASLRARGLSWEAVARAMKCRVQNIKRMTRIQAGLWQQFLQAAVQQVEGESVAEAVTVLRRLLRSDDDELAGLAACLLVALPRQKSIIP